MFSSAVFSVFCQNVFDDKCLTLFSKSCPNMIPIRRRQNRSRILCCSRLHYARKTARPLKSTFQCNTAGPCKFNFGWKVKFKCNCTRGAVPCSVVLHMLRDDLLLEMLLVNVMVCYTRCCYLCMHAT